MIAKAGLGLIGLSAISVGGVALANPGWLGMGEDPMPEYHTLDKDNNYSTTYGNEKHFGKKYGKYLAGVTKDTGANGQGAKEHKDWWKWALWRLDKAKVSLGKFSKNKVTIHYDGEKTTALNQICKAAYGTEDQGNNFDENNTDGTKFKKSDVWKYCSIGGTQPQTISEFNNGKTNEGDKEKYDNEKIGSDTSEQSKWLSIKSPDNDWIWDLKDKEFRNTTINPEGYFKTEKDKTGEEKKTLKEICKGAYGQNEVSEAGKNKLEKADVTKYCSLEQISAS